MLEYRTTCVKKMSTPADSRHPLHPILWSLSLLGIHVRQGGAPEPAGVRRFLRRLHAAVSLLAFHYWALSDVAWYFRNRIREDMVAESVTVWAAVGTVDLMLLVNAKTLGRVLETVREETERMPVRQKARYGLVVKAVAAAIWVYVLAFMSQYLVESPAEAKYQRYFSNTPLHFFHAAMSRAGVRALYRVDRCVECLVVQGALTFSIALYVLACWNARLWYRSLGGEDFPDVRRFRARFERLCQGVYRLDAAFSLSAALWLLMIVVNLCVRILCLLNRECRTQAIPTVTLAVARAALTLVTACLAAHEVSREAACAAARMQQQGRGAGGWGPGQYQEVQLSQARSALFPVQLTAWKFAALNRGFLMTSVGVMATYVIICIQLNPSAMESLVG